MLAAADVKLCSLGLLLLLGLLANLFNLGGMLLQRRQQQQQRRSEGDGGARAVATIICSVSLGNILQQVSTFVLMASLRAGVLCRPQLPSSFVAVLFVWLSSSSVSFWSVAWLSLLYCVRVPPSSSSSPALRALREKISSILAIGLPLTPLTSCAVFAPFLFLSFHREPTLGSGNATVEVPCAPGKPLFPAWVHVNAYAVVFICYLALMPLAVMLPSSLSLVVFLCGRTSSARGRNGGGDGGGQRAARSYLLVCGLTVALVWVHLATLLTISFYYFHATFASGLRADVLFLGLSVYCVACSVLLTCSNATLRERLRALLRRGTPRPAGGEGTADDV